MKMPMREIHKKYTRSDMAWLAWDSKQKSYNMSKNFKHSKVSGDSNVGHSNVREDSDSYHLPDGVNNGTPIPKSFFNEEGELDLRLATGPQACSYLRGLGVPIM